jgi:2-oxoglutarate ferredoxin oxidoreductase subunit alpha
MGQSRAIIDRPPDAGGEGERLTVEPNEPGYKRYLNTESGVSPMSIPGTPGVPYTADGLEHNEKGIPSSQAGDHRMQLDKRERKLALYDYGPRWADIEGDGELAVITFGSTTSAAREALARLKEQGVRARLIALRLLAPIRPKQLSAALAGVARVLVIEQNHGGQLYRYLRSMYDLPRTAAYHRPGPLPLRPGELAKAIADWASSHVSEKVSA